MSTRETLIISFLVSENKFSPQTRDIIYEFYTLENISHFIGPHEL